MVLFCVIYSTVYYVTLEQAIPEVMTPQEVAPYAELCRDLLSGRRDASAHTHDLGSHVESETPNVPQVMWPSLYLEGGGGAEASELHRRTAAMAKNLMGDDMAFDFDMVISKGAGKDVETPWHQGEPSFNRAGGDK